MEALPVLDYAYGHLTAGVNYTNMEAQNDSDHNDSKTSQNHRECNYPFFDLVVRCKRAFVYQSTYVNRLPFSILHAKPRPWI